MHRFKLFMRVCLSLGIFTFFSSYLNAANTEFSLKKENEKETISKVKGFDNLSIFSVKSLEEAINVCKTIALDNITWIAGLQKFWSTPDNKTYIINNIIHDLPHLEKDNILKTIDSFLNSYLAQKKFWQDSLSMLNQVKDKINMIGSVLNIILDQHIKFLKDYFTCVSNDNPFIKKMVPYFPGNFENSEVQAVSLLDVFNELLPLAPLQYQQDYNELNFELSEGTSDYIKPEKINSFLQFNIGCVLNSRYKFQLPLLKEIELHTASVFESTLNKFCDNLQIKFPESNLSILIGSLPQFMAKKYVSDYITTKTLEEKKIRTKSKKNMNLRNFTLSINPLNRDDRDINDLLEEINGKPEKNKKTENKKGKKNKKGKGKSPASKNQETIINTTSLDTSSFNQTETSHTGAHDDSIESSSLSITTENKTNDLLAPSNTAGSSNLPHALKYKTLALAANQNSTSPLFIDSDVKHKKAGLKDYQKAMLANLLKINNDGKYGELKASHTYNWDDLIGLLKRLGFSMSRNHLFTFSPAQQIRLHYLHYDDKRLNDDLLGIMFKQLDNIGFTKGYLISLL